MLRPENNKRYRTFYPFFLVQPEPMPHLRLIVLRLCCIALTVLFLPLAASAQNGITIGGSSDLNFGTLSRSGAVDIGYESAGAAQFIVTGDSGRTVRLTISVSALTARSGASTRAPDRTFDPAITNSDCAYSLDGGGSWHPFSSGTLYQNTRFPDDASGTGTIYVRIGGSLASSTRQQRGGYSGLVTLTAEYR